jgi:hypothetical protein
MPPVVLFEPSACETRSWMMPATVVVGPVICWVAVLIVLVVAGFEVGFDVGFVVVVDIGLGACCDFTVETGCDHVLATGVVASGIGSLAMLDTVRSMPCKITTDVAASVTRSLVATVRRGDFEIRGTRTRKPSAAPMATTALVVRRP